MNRIFPLFEGGIVDSSNGLVQGPRNIRADKWNKLNWSEQTVYNNRQNYYKPTANASISPYTDEKYWNPKERAKAKKNKNKRTTKNPTGSNIKGAVRDASRRTYATPKTKFELAREQQRQYVDPDKPVSPKAAKIRGEGVNKTPSGQAGKSPVKPQGFKHNLDHYPRIKATGTSIMDFTKRHKKSIVGAIALTGVTLAMSKINSTWQNKNNFVKSPRLTNMDNRSSYMPNSYKRGFDDIKSRTTDFGSRVHLNKTISKVMVTAKNSTRNSYRTSTRSIRKNNIALKAYDNAINHTRY